MARTGEKRLTGAGRNNQAESVPEPTDEQSADTNVIRVEALVQEYLAAQSLKILPQGEFEDAVNQFVNKDDKNAMDSFVSVSLANQLKDLVALDCEEDELPDAMEQWRNQREKVFQTALRKSGPRPDVVSRPDEWDSDMDGRWETQRPAQNEPPGKPASRTQARGRGGSALPNGDDGGDISMSDTPAEAPQARAPAKRSAATRAAPTKKAPPKKAAPKGRGKKKGPFVDDDEDEDADVFLDEEAEPPAPLPKRAPPTRTSARAKQTTLNFSQSQQPTRGREKALEISADEISDDDAFESMPPTRSRRR